MQAAKATAKMLDAKACTQSTRGLVVSSFSCYHKTYFVRLQPGEFVLKDRFKRKAFVVKHAFFCHDVVQFLRELHCWLTTDSVQLLRPLL